MIVPAVEIAERIKAEDDYEADPLVIRPTPSIEETGQGGSASIDLRLGTWFETPRPRRTPVLDIFNQGDPEYSEKQLTKTCYVPFGGRFLLHPRNFVLAVTLEWIRIPSDLAGFVAGKSKWGRRGLIIATATGVHPRFTGCLTLELANVGEIPIAIYPGLAICQLFLHRLTKAAPLTNQTAFSGFARPTLGTLEPDPFARRLFESGQTIQGFTDSDVSETGAS